MLWHVNRAAVGHPSLSTHPSDGKSPLGWRLLQSWRKARLAISPPPLERRTGIWNLLRDIIKQQHTGIMFWSRKAFLVLKNEKACKPSLHIIMLSRRFSSHCVTLRMKSYDCGHCDHYKARKWDLSIVVHCEIVGESAVEGFSSCWLASFPSGRQYHLSV